MSIINSFNIFVDTHQSMTGLKDDFIVNAGRNAINCKDGEGIRISLESFNMYKQFYGVNEYNNKINIFYTSSWFNNEMSGTNDAVERIDIPAGDYNSIGDIAQAFKTALTASKAFANYTITAEPQAGQNTISNTNAKQIQFKFVRKTGTYGAYGTIDNIYLNTDDDTNTLLGATLNDDLTNSFDFEFSNNNTIIFKSRFLPQTETEEFLYLRTDLVSNNLEAEGLTPFSNQGHLHNSNILARIPIQNKFVHFSTQTGKEFFINVPNKSINTIRFHLTDSKGRKFPSIHPQQKNEGGNFHLTMVLKVEIIKYFDVPDINDQRPKTNVPDRMLGVLDHMDFGNPRL